MQFVIPQFVYLFHTYDVTLPKVTEVILFFYHFVSQYVYGIFLFLCASIVLVVISFKNKIWQEHLLHFFIRLPGLKTIIQTYFTILFCTQLGYLLFAHISLYNALTKMSQNSHSTFLGKRARAIAEQLLLGVELSSVLEQEKWFVPELPSVVYFAEKNGQLAQQLIQYGNYLESFMLERWLSRIKWLEPMLLTVIGIVTAYLFVALFMPVFQLLDSL
jgi:competence protein ComGB